MHIVVGGSITHCRIMKAKLNQIKRRKGAGEEVMSFEWFCFLPYITNFLTESSVFEAVKSLTPNCLIQRRPSVSLRGVAVQDIHTLQLFYNTYVYASYSSAIFRHFQCMFQYNNTQDNTIIVFIQLNYCCLSHALDSVLVHA